MQDWQHEIFKSYVDGSTIELYIESKYAGEIDYLLQGHGIEVISKDAGLAFVILVGLGLGHDPALISSVLTLCEQYHVQRSINNEQSIELLLPQTHLKEAVRTLHKAFIEDKI